LQQKERAMHGAMTDALLHMLTGRYVRSVKAAEQVLQISKALQSVKQLGDTLPKHLPPMQILAHLIAAASAHALRDRELRTSHFDAAISWAMDKPLANWKKPWKPPN
jgi:HemY protein